jgi:hypothetical protein
MPVRDISRMRPFSAKSEYVNVIIETPKGSRTKFKYDEESGLFIFDKRLPIGQSFPFEGENHATRAAGWSNRFSEKLRMMGLSSFTKAAYFIRIVSSCVPALNSISACFAKPVSQ